MSIALTDHPQRELELLEILLKIEAK